MFFRAILVFPSAVAAKNVRIDKVYAGIRLPVVDALAVFAARSLQHDVIAVLANDEDSASANYGFGKHGGSPIVPSLGQINVLDAMHPNVGPAFVAGVLGASPDKCQIRPNGSVSLAPSLSDALVEWICRRV